MNENPQQVFLDTDLSIREIRHAALPHWLGREADGEEDCAKLFQDLLGGQIGSLSAPVLADGKTVCREQSFLRSDGETLWLRFTLAPWVRKRKLVGIVVTIENIDQEKEHLLQAERRNQVKQLSLLSRQIASRFRQPLAGMADRINTALLAPERADLRQALDQLRTLIHDLVRLCETLDGLVIDERLHNQRVDVGQALQKSVDVASILFSQTGIQFDLAAPPLASRIRGNEVTLEQCFLHILRNAAESMPQGGTVFIRPSLDSMSHLLRITVKDQGTGMNEQAVAQACEPFYSTKKGDHLGLGLSISYAIMMIHHGSIKITSVLGQGTTVTLTLPLEQDYLAMRTTYGKSKSE